MARLVGDLGAEEDAHVLLGRGAHHRPELRGHPLLADEERGQPVHALVALLLGDPLVPVDPVLGEVDVLHRPLLALPQVVELAVAQQLRLPAVGGLHEPRGRWWPGSPRDPCAGSMRAEPTEKLAGWPTYGPGSADGLHDDAPGGAVSTSSLARPQAGEASWTPSHVAIPRTSGLPPPRSS